MTDFEDGRYRLMQFVLVRRVDESAEATLKQGLTRAVHPTAHHRNATGGGLDQHDSEPLPVLGIT